MSRLNQFFSASALVAFSAAANAQFTASHAGPLDSADAYGEPGNGTFSAPYTGASTIFTSRTFSADLTSNMAGTWEADSQWNLGVQPSGFGYTVAPSQFGEFTGTVNVSNTQNGLFWFNTGDTVTFEAFQAYDNGAGADATWTNTSFGWNGAVSHYADLGVFLDKSPLTFDTVGSSGITDTEIALYTLGGLLVGTNDDIAEGNLLSSLSMGTISSGNYILVIGGFDSTFFDGVATPGVDSGSFGDFNLNVNGSSVSTGSIASGTFKTYSFQVVPEPASMAALGLGVTALLRRRRK